MVSLQFPEFHTERLVVRLLGVDEADKMLAFRLDNRAHLEPWEPIRQSEFYTANYWQMQLQALRRECYRGQALCLSLLDKSEQEVLGVCNFTNIVRGTFQSCHLGYAMAKQHEGQQLMQEALKPACEFVFDEMGLHRIMANYMPRNKRSGKLLANLGFEIEGHARKLLLINGRWEDHVLTARVNPKSL